MEAVTLKERLASVFGGNKSALARSLGKDRTQVRLWLASGALWVDGAVYVKTAERKKRT